MRVYKSSLFKAKSHCWVSSSFYTKLITQTTVIINSQFLTHTRNQITMRRNMFPLQLGSQINNTQKLFVSLWKENNEELFLAKTLYVLSCGCYCCSCCIFFFSTGREYIWRYLIVPLLKNSIQRLVESFWTFEFLHVDFWKFKIQNNIVGEIFACTVTSKKKSDDDKLEKIIPRFVKLNFETNK